MGCAAAMNGLGVATDYARAASTDSRRPNALLVCVEVSSVHGAFDDDMNSAITHALFADGCAACVVGPARAAATSEQQVAIVDQLSHLVDGTSDGIRLDIADGGITRTSLHQSLNSVISVIFAE